MARIWYELWTLDTGNIVADYESEADALAEVQENGAAHGREAVSDWALARNGDDHHWANGNHGVSEWTITGTTSTGTHIEVRGCDLFEFRGDKILRKDSYWKIVE